VAHRVIGRAPADDRLAAGAARAIWRGFRTYQSRFARITRRAPFRHQARDWLGLQHDAVARLDLHEQVVDGAEAEVRRLLAARADDKALWAAMKRRYAALCARAPAYELAETFFNSVTRRVLGTVGVDPAVEYLDSDFDRVLPPATPPPYTRYPRRDTVEALVADVLGRRRVQVANQAIDFDAGPIARAIETERRRAWGDLPIDAIEVLDPVFYRNKGAYLIGRLVGDGRLMPLVVALVNRSGRVVVDAVLLTENEASIVFSFTRSSFLVDVEAPREVIRFLHAIMPLKRVAELYIALGYTKHGKAELYRDLVRHLARSDDRFEIAPGDPGLVMVVFTLPSYDIVFKVIRDGFRYPKTTTREHVMARYRLVFRHDRAGRLADAQEFEQLAFPRDRFSEALLAELGAEASRSVSVDGDRVVFRHLYTERRVRPLNLYLREAEATEAREVVLDYGRAIKDLAATNIFPGDLLLKNFGVTRHGRVIFYDYDELCLLTDCSFRRMPESRDYDDEIAAEPWFHVGPLDIFPEELPRFMGLYGKLKDVLLEAHGDLFGTEFWTGMQALHRAGEVVDIFPYRESRRLRNGGPGPAW
jgi:isocitrate dehydrogenase kinase/phosphatase